MIIFTLLVFVIILGLLIFVHELGHFVVAKRAGMKVEEFGFGFPPKIFGIKKGETLYSLNLIPLGGFVKILGEEGLSSDPRAFANGSFGHRLIVLLAGVLMNFFLGWFLLFLGFSVIGTPVQIAAGENLDHVSLSRDRLTIIAIQDKSPAEHAGFKNGDVIVSVDGKKISNIDELIQYNETHEGQKVTYELGRGKQIVFRDVTPRVNPPAGVGPVGFEPAVIATAKYPLLQSLKLSWDSFLYRFLGILGALGSLFYKLVTTGRVVSGFSGPVGIAVLTQDVARLGLVYLVQFTAVLSINLGVINAFPFPALDGGRVLFLFIEKIRGVKSLKLEQMANLIGFALLLLLMVVVTFRDITRFSQEFKRLFERIL